MRVLTIITVFLFAFGCTGERIEETAEEIPKPVLNELSFLDGPNLIEEAGNKMLHPDPEIKIVEKIVKEKCPDIQIKKKSVVAPQKFNKRKRIKDGYKLTWHYGRKKCRGEVYEKEFQNSYFMLFVDCNNNYTTQRMRK